MKAFLTHLKLQFIMDFREKGTLLTFYLVPLVFYAVMGAVFSSINPASKQTLTASMSIFAITMGAVIGMPAPLVKMREAGVLRAYRVSGIPNWALLLTQSVSAALHLLVVSAVILLTAPLFFGASLPINYGAYLLTLLAVLFSSIAIGLLIGITGRNHAMATMLSQAVFLPSLLLGGLMFPTNLLPEALQWVGKIFPATHGMEAFLTGTYGMEGNVGAAASIALTACIGVAVLILALAHFRKTSRN